MNPTRSGISRRGFLLGAAAGLGVGVPLTWLAARRFPMLAPALGPVTPERSTERSGLSAGDVMPGRYPGRVVEVHHPLAVSPDNVIHAPTVESMVDRGMSELAGYEPGDARAAWASMFSRGDIVGIKVNPVGKKPSPQSSLVGSISSFELLVKVVRSLQQVGVRPQDIIVFERYANEFCAAGYKDVVERELPGVRWLCSALGYTNTQLDVRGRDEECEPLSPEVESHVVGYDPDVFATMGFAAPEHSAKDDRRFRSHLSMIVARMIDKMITLPVLKDHRSAGVTFALKNMSHGMNNNVARSHISGIAHGFGSIGKVLGPNQCNTFIPQAVSQHRLRQKATLHILDGLIGVYEGGPGPWNATWGTWRRKSLFFATDPVAMDHVCWDILDLKRAEEGWAPVERMGLLYQTEATPYASSVASLAGGHPLASLTMTAATENMARGRASEAFNVRQPDHVVLAGQLGLGVFDRERITYRRVLAG